MTDRIEKTIELNAPVSRVWRALTDQEGFFGVFVDVLRSIFGGAP